MSNAKPYSILLRDTVVARAASLASARRIRDRRDNAYGSYAHSIRLDGYEVFRAASGETVAVVSTVAEANALCDRLQAETGRTHDYAAPTAIV